MAYSLSGCLALVVFFALYRLIFGRLILSCPFIPFLSFARLVLCFGSLLISPG